MAEEIAADVDTPPVFRVGIHSGPLMVVEVGDDRRSAISALRLSYIVHYFFLVSVALTIRVV